LNQSLAEFNVSLCDNFLNNAWLFNF
jgi:hypothetical protein